MRRLEADQGGGDTVTDNTKCDQIFSGQVSPDSAARSWAMTCAHDFARVSDLFYIGWTFEQVLEHLDLYADDYELETGDTEMDAVAEWRSMPLDAKHAIVSDAMRVICAATYEQASWRVHITEKVRRFFSMMPCWWPTGVRGAPLSDHAMFGTELPLDCACCGREFGRQEEFRVIVYGSIIAEDDQLRYPGRTYQKVPICWACLMGAQTR